MLKPRTRKGYALLSVLVLSTFAMVSLLALASVFLSIGRAEAVQNQKNLLLSAIDTGLDYAISNLNNNPPDSLTTSQFDLPSSNLPNLNPPLAVKIRLTPVKDYAGGVDWDTVNAFSVLQSPPLNTIPPVNEYSVNGKRNFWYLCEITASRGAFSRSARAMLEPQTTSPTDINNVSLSTPSTPLFPAPLFANSLLNFTPSGKLDVKAISGDLSLFSNDKTSISGSNTTINGDLSSNEIIGADTRPTVTGTVTSPNLPDSTQLNYSSYISTYSNQSYSPSPTTSVGATVDIPANSTVNLQTSSYSTGSLVLDGSNTVNLPSSPSSPTKIFVDSNTATPLKIDTSSLNYGSSSSSADFQLYYDGTQDITITANAKPFNGLIYAPRAKVTVDGSKAFNGAILADTVDIKNSEVNLLSDISTTGGPMAERNNNYGLSLKLNGSQLGYLGYQPVTWQETSNRLVE